MLNSNALCQVRKVSGFDVYGKPRLGTAVTERCAILKLKRELQHTTVRADASQSRGHADEFVATNKVHLDSTTTAALGDQLSVGGVLLKITSLNPSYDVLGPLDHYEVGGELWA
jgi:hypothetical protein